MRTSIGFKLSTASLTAILFIVSVAVPVRADNASRLAEAAKKLAKKAKPLVDRCRELEEAAKAARKAADDAQQAANDAQQAADDAQAAADDASMADLKAFYDAQDARKAADVAADAASRAKLMADLAKISADRAAAGVEKATGEDKKAAEDAKKDADVDKKAADDAKKDADDAKKAADAEAAKAADQSAKARAEYLEKQAAADAKQADADEKQKDADAKQADANAKKAAADAAEEAAKEPCDRAEEARDAADKALDAAEAAIDEKIRKSGKTPPKKDLEDKEKIGGWRDELHPKDKDKSNEPPKTVEPLKPGIIIAPGADNVQTKTANGLQTVTFDTLHGKVIVNLPDDVHPGDTLSGSVFTEPKGSTDEEKAKNKSALIATVLDLGGTRVTADRPTFMWTPQMPQPQTPIRYQLKVVEILGKPVPTTQPGAVIIPNPATTQPGAVVTTGTVNIPSLGQPGRPVKITGQFDGNSSNTKVTIEPVTTGPTLAANVLIMAESRGGIVFTNPVKVAGPMQLTVNEGGRATTAPFRNVSVNLTAPKTNLLKGDTTTVTVRFDGLKGITENVPFRLRKSGVVTMQGGDVQTRVIKPYEVQPDGSFTMTRTVTGQQAGVFTVTATVTVPAPGNIVAKSLTDEELKQLSDDQLQIKLDNLRGKLKAEGKRSTTSDEYKRLEKEIARYEAEKKRRG